MDINLWALRFKSFGWSLLGIIGTSVAGYLLSTDFQNFLSKQGLSAGTVALIMLLITEGIKHLRNKKVLKDAPLGSLKRQNIQLI